MTGMTKDFKFLLVPVAILALLTGFLFGKRWRNQHSQPELPALPPSVISDLTTEQKQRQLDKALENPDFKRVHDDVLGEQPYLRIDCDSEPRDE